MFIYKFHNITNGKVYIGKTENPEKRYSSHIRSAQKGSQLLLHRALRKYGETSFSFTILEENIDPSVIDEREIFYIRSHDCCVLDGHDKGYNMTRGGDGFDSATSSYYLTERTSKGENPFSKGNSGYEAAMEHNNKRIQEGTHNFLTEKHRKKVSDTQKQLVKSGDHSLSGIRGSEQSKRVQKKRIEEGTFHMLSAEMKEHQRTKTLQAIMEGRHNSQIEHICPHCRKSGKGTSMFRWHFNNCKNLD